MMRGIRGVPQAGSLSAAASLAAVPAAGAATHSGKNAAAVAVICMGSKGGVTPTTEDIAKLGADRGQTVCSVSRTNAVNGGTLTVPGSLTGVFR